MSARHYVPDDLPTLEALGYDLLTTTTAQRVRSLVRPFAWALAYAVFAGLGWWIPAVLSIAGLFLGVVATTHDLVHRTLGLPRWLSEVAMALVGMLVLESAHAYRATHLQHHRTFPDDDDPEGDPAHGSWWRALLAGPTFLYRLWVWAWRRVPEERGWLLLEAGWFLGVVALAVALWPAVPALGVYVALVIVGSWTYPLTTVYLPHDATAADALRQTKTLRGRCAPRLLLELSYHLEHHLYPAVPSHHYAELSRRLEPYLEAHGVEPVRFW